MARQARNRLQMPPDITIRRVTVESILPLRHRILRAGLPAEAAAFDGDADASTLHYAACRGAEPVACLSLMASAWEGRPAWQLRGMATDAPEQGRGLGRRLLEHAVAEGRRTAPDRLFWCNARTSAIGFYERFGWRVASERFDIPTAGPHVRMVLAPAPAGRPPAAAFVALELSLLAAAHLLGGPPWVALGALACVLQVVADFRVGPLIGLAPAVGWAVAHHLTGNRELFFPFAMALAAHAAGQFSRRGRPAATAAGGLVVAAFLAIRVLQRAGGGVLAVEAVVAVAILSAVVAILPLVQRRPWAGMAVAVVASLAAYAGLAL